MNKKLLEEVKKFRREKYKRFRKLVRAILGRDLVNGQFKKAGIKRYKMHTSELSHKEPVWTR